MILLKFLEVQYHLIRIHQIHKLDHLIDISLITPLHRCNNLQLEYLQDLQYISMNTPLFYFHRKFEAYYLPYYQLQLPIQQSKSCSRHYLLLTIQLFEWIASIPRRNKFRSFLYELKSSVPNHDYSQRLFHHTGNLTTGIRNIQ